MFLQWAIIVGNSFQQNSRECWTNEPPMLMWVACDGSLSRGMLSLSVGSQLTIISSCYFYWSNLHLDLPPPFRALNPSIYFPWLPAVFCSALMFGHLAHLYSSLRRSWDTTECESLPFWKANELQFVCRGQNILTWEVKELNVIIGQQFFASWVHCNPGNIWDLKFWWPNFWSRTDSAEVDSSSAMIMISVEDLHTKDASVSDTL